MYILFYFSSFCLVLTTLVGSISTLLQILIENTYSHLSSPHKVINLLQYISVPVKLPLLAEVNH